MRFLKFQTNTGSVAYIDPNSIAAVVDTIPLDSDGVYKNILILTLHTGTVVTIFGKADDVVAEIENAINHG